MMVMINHGGSVVGEMLIGTTVVLTTTTLATVLISMVINKNILIVRLRKSCLLLPVTGVFVSFQGGLQSISRCLQTMAQIRCRANH